MIEPGRSRDVMITDRVGRQCEATTLNVVLVYDIMNYRQRRGDAAKRRAEFRQGKASL